MSINDTDSQRRTPMINREPARPDPLETAQKLTPPIPEPPPGHRFSDPVDHPLHYGGKDNPYEAIKVIEAWRLGFNLGNTVKYISRAGKKGSPLEDLKKARWYLDREISNLERKDSNK